MSTEASRLLDLVCPVGALHSNPAFKDIIVGFTINKSSATPEEEVEDLSRAK